MQGDDIITEKFNRARFWKCALQVNPASYIAYRGIDHRMTEEQYNQELLHVCKEEGISVIGFANHGSVDGLDAIRQIMNQNDIVVFPGFEISSSEKAHFVCLFPETTAKDDLNRYLGSLGLTNSENDVWPSNLGGIDLLKKVNELGGFAYAAHCTEGSGVLCRRLQHVWRNSILKAAQIKGTIEDYRRDIREC